MRHTIPVPRANYCDHGILKSELTRDGEPACALCRHAKRAQDARMKYAATAPDWALLASGDDTSDELNIREDALPPAPELPDNLVALADLLDSHPEAFDVIKEALAEMQRPAHQRLRYVQCSECPTVFPARSSQARTCSNACRMARSRRRAEGSRGPADLLASV